MKVLFISHHNEESGVGRAAREYIRAMDKVGLDVVPRSVKLGLVQESPEDIKKLEEKSPEGCTHCIQFLLPHQMRFSGEFEKCVAIFDYECDNFAASGWPYLVDMFSEVWVPCQDSLRQLSQSGVKSDKIKVVPHAVNPSRFKRTPKPIITSDSFLFYFIGDVNNRKNLASVIKAFHSEFGIDEQVGLILKLYKHGINPQELQKDIVNYINQIKTALKLYPSVDHYKKEMVITDFLKDEDILNLHHSCHCLLAPSHGEAFNYVVLDALGEGRPVIASDVGGHPELITSGSTDGDNGFLISAYTESPVEGMLETFPQLGTGFENWYNLDITSMKYAMRQVYRYWCYECVDAGLYKKYSENARKVPEKFSYEKVGNRIKELLCSQ